MAKAKFRPWDPAEVIKTGQDAALFFKISLENYDPNVFHALMDCIARSKGVAEIAGVEFSDTVDGGRSVTITTTSGMEETIAIAPAVSLESVRQAFAPRDQAVPKAFSRQ